jgi:hypothetical protein
LHHVFSAGVTRKKARCQSIGTTSGAESPFIVTWKCPELQRTRHTDDPSLERSFSITLAQGLPLARIAAASSPFETSCAATPISQPNATAPTAVTSIEVRKIRCPEALLIIAGLCMYYLHFV